MRMQYHVISPMASLRRVVNDIKHQRLFKTKSKEALELTIEPRVLEVALKGGGWSPQGVAMTAKKSSDAPVSNGGMETFF